MMGGAATPAGPPTLRRWRLPALTHTPRPPTRPLDAGDVGISVATIPDGSLSSLTVSAAAPLCGPRQTVNRGETFPFLDFLLHTTATPLLLRTQVMSSVVGTHFLRLSLPPPSLSTRRCLALRAVKGFTAQPGF